MHNITSDISIPVIVSWFFFILLYSDLVLVAMFLGHLSLMLSIFILKLQEWIIWERRSFISQSDDKGPVFFSMFRGNRHKIWFASGIPDNKNNIKHIEGEFLLGVPMCCPGTSWYNIFIVGKQIRWKINVYFLVFNIDLAWKKAINQNRQKNASHFIGWYICYSRYDTAWNLENS